jgi:hypothetical protein
MSTAAALAVAAAVKPCFAAVLSLKKAPSAWEGMEACHSFSNANYSNANSSNGSIGNEQSGRKSKASSAAAAAASADTAVSVVLLLYAFKRSAMT